MHACRTTTLACSAPPLKQLKQGMTTGRSSTKATDNWRPPSRRRKVFAQLSRRIGIENGREARLLVAVDPSTGALRGCVDLAVHLFDRLEQRFELTIDEMPENGRKRYSWLPYVASLAVSPESRRQGIARCALLRAPHARCCPELSSVPPFLVAASYVGRCGAANPHMGRRTTISHVSRTYLAGRAARMHLLTTRPPPSPPQAVDA